MSEPTRRRVAPACLISLIVAVGLLAPSSAGAITAKQCEARVNDTPAKLMPCIQTDDLWDHMQAFQEIADDNPGPDGHPSRNSGEPGYLASVRLRRAEDEAGRIQRHDPAVQVRLLLLRRHADVERDRRRRRTTSRSSTTGTPGRATATRPTPTIQPAGGIVLPPTPTPSSTSGCTAADFSRLHAGKIALIQRGTLQLRREGAERPGRGRGRRGHLQRGQPRPHRRLQRQPAATPTATRSSRRSRWRSRRSPSASSLYNEYTGRHAAAHEPRRPRRSSTRTATTGTSSRSPRAATRTTSLVVDAHLDAIFGAGMLDNASGSATILDIAEQMKNVQPAQQAAVHLVRRRGARPAGLAVLRQQPHAEPS